MRVLFRADASDRIGGGHVMRCLTLADALAARGARAGFVCGAITDGLADRIRSNGHKLDLIEPLPAQRDAGAAWDLTVHEPAAQAADAGRTAAAAAGPAATDWLVVDHYGLDSAWEGAAGRTTTAVLVIDDLANRTHECNLLLDPTFGRSADDYAALVPAHCEVLTGALYAPLRSEFAAARKVALARRATAVRVETLLISLGSTDVGGVTGRVLHDVLRSGVTCTVDVVLSLGAPSFETVQTLSNDSKNVRLHVDSDEMARLMTEADLAIGAAGTTSWERCCLGLPTLTLVLAENQRFIARQLERAQAHRVAPNGGGEVFRTALTALIADAGARRAMSERAAAVTDGRGSDRICDVMLALASERRN